MNMKKKSNFFLDIIIENAVKNIFFIFNQTKVITSKNLC